MRAAAVFLLALTACGKPGPAPQPAADATAQADPLLGTVDKLEVRLSHVRDRLARLPATLATDDAARMAIVAAAQDQLAVREMHVLKQQEQPGERPWQAAERFAGDVWRGDATCEADPGELKLLYLQQLARYKHPAKFAIWDAQLQCCPDPGDCPAAGLKKCRDATLPLMQKLADALRARMAALPALGLAADVTDVDIEQSPVKGARTDAFEAETAAQGTADSRLQLRRYEFYRQGEPGMGSGHFRPGDPETAKWVETAKLGDVSAPIPAVWGWSVVLLAAREPTRSGKADPEVMARLRAEACQKMAERQRQDWRDGLLRAAQIRWNQTEIEKNFSAKVFGALPRNAAPFGQK